MGDWMWDCVGELGHIGKWLSLIGFMCGGSGGDVLGVQHLKQWKLVLHPCMDG